MDLSAQSVPLCALQYFPPYKSDFLPGSWATASRGPMIHGFPALPALFQQVQDVGIFRIPGPQFSPESPGQNGFLQQVDLGKGGLGRFFYSILFLI